ncbi:MAG: hypothetical protein ACLQHK_02240 [Gallionellaceae bacterium]
MAKDIIEILTFIDSEHALQRMKLDAITHIKKNDFDFRRFGEGGEQTACVLINGLEMDFDNNPWLIETLRGRARTAVIMLFIADLYPRMMQLLPTWSAMVDIFLVPTPEMRNFLRAFTDCRVEILFDPVDFCLNDSLVKPGNNDPFKVVWFGYPESYQKSMVTYEKSLRLLHQSNEIEYHIVSKHSQYGRTASCVIHEYVPNVFLSLLNTFDVCVLSHVPCDFFTNTYWKSENKAVLAINRGLPCVATRTPAYERLFTRCGLQDYLFSSNAELASSIRRLKSWQERDRFLSQSQHIVLENYSALKMAEDWLHFYREEQARKKCSQKK